MGLGICGWKELFGVRVGVYRIQFWTVSRRGRGFPMIIDYARYCSSMSVLYLF